MQTYTQNNQGNSCYTHINTLILSIEATETISKCQQAFFPTGQLHYLSPHYYSLLSHNPQGDLACQPGSWILCKRNIRRKGVTFYFSLSAAQRLLDRGTSDFSLLWCLQSHECYVYEAYWYWPDVGKQLLHQDTSALIVPLSTPRSPFF